MSFLRGFLSSPSEEESKQGGVETIEKLCDRLETATLLDDRRDAIRALRALSKSFQVEIGTHAMDMLINVIKEDSTDIEVTEMVIETLLNVMASKGENPPATDLGVQFTEMFVKTEDNVALLLSLLEEYEFHVRWPTVKLLILLLKNRSKDLQERVLESPMGISKLMDLLSDSREIIRNDGLLLMIKLTRNNPSIQKIVAFENAFERLLHIVSVEGNSDGGIIVEDCLSLLLNLLRNNLSNQNFFRETSNIQRITPYFEMPATDEEDDPPPVWNVQKQTNILLMLDILQVLISPTNNPQSVTSCQKVMYTRGIYMRLMDLLLYPTLPTDIFATLLVTIGDIIRGNEIIQQFMDELEMSERPAILLMLMFMVNDKQPFKARLAALYCVQCFLFKNQKGQARIVSTLLPNQEDVQASVTSGQLLCAGLFSSDHVAHWLCSVTLAHCLYNNTAQHENMLLVQLELTAGLPPVHLVNQVFQMLASESDTRTQFGALMLLLHWVEECPGAVTTLLNNPAFVPHILELVEHRDGQDASASLMSSLAALLLGMCLKYNDNACQQYSKATLLHLISHRVGKENYTELLESTSVKPLFTQASKTPHPTATIVDELALDYCFTKFFKKQQDLVTRTLDGDEEAESENTIESHDQIVTGYKDLIKQQDEEINRLKEELAQCSSSSSSSSAPPQQIEQLQQYAKDQEQYYQQYIAKLQAWYTDEIGQLQTLQSSSPSAADPATASAVTSSQPDMTSSQPDMTSEQYEQLLEERDSQAAIIEQLKREALEQTGELRQTATSQYTRLQELRQERQQQDQYVSQLVSQLEQMQIAAAAPHEGQESSQTEHQKDTEVPQLLDPQNAVYLDLEHQLVALKEKLSQTESETIISKKKLSDTDFEVVCLKEKLTDSESKISGLKELLAEKENNLTILQEKLSQSESGFAILRERLSQSESETSIVKEKLVQSESSRHPGGVADDVSERLQSLIRELEESRAQNEQLVGYRGKCVELEQELNSIKVAQSEVQHAQPSTEEQTTPQASQDSTPQASHDSTPQASQDSAPQTTSAPETREYLYDYSQWFTPVIADDGNTYYRSTDGHFYTEEQYLYTIEQYEQYYRVQQQENNALEQQTAEQQQQTEQETAEQHQQTEQRTVEQKQQQTEQRTVEQKQQQTEQETAEQQQQTEQQTAEQQQQTEQKTAEQKQQQTEQETAEQQQQTEEQTTAREQQTEQQNWTSTTQQHPTGPSKEINELKLEVERSKSEIERLKWEVQRLQSERKITGHLTKSTTTHHDIECATRVCRRTHIDQIDISGDHMAQTPDMTSSSTDSELTLLQEKYDNLSTEQEDLLVLLAHQDKKLAQLKARLRVLGDEVNSSESEDDFDDLMDSCEDLPEADQLTGDGRLM